MIIPNGTGVSGVIIPFANPVTKLNKFFTTFSAMSVGSIAGGGFESVEFSVAICAWIASRGSMAMPRTATTSAPMGFSGAGEGEGELMALEIEWDVVLEKVPRNRKMADGFSFESLKGECEKTGEH